MPEVQEETHRMLGELRWIEKVEQVFEICKCAEEDKVMFAASTFEGHALTWWNENVHTLGLVNGIFEGFLKRIKGNITSSKPTTLQEAINIARELVERAVQGKAARPGPCPPRCSKCHKHGHEQEDCRTRIPVARGNSLQNVTCFGCGEKGHYRDKCPRERNPQNEGARGRAYLMRNEEPQQDPNVITGAS
nr:hypothetical protein [Tanacetum cinerariifolium]